MNNRSSDSIIILMADDDPEDRMLAQDALEEAHLGNEIHFVIDGEDLIDYLCRRGRHEYLKSTPLPGLILLDLNMPKKDGREALGEIKSNDRLKHIPIVVLTTSKAEIDIVRTYNLGVNSFITKPVTFDGLVEIMQALNRYWFNIVTLPPEDCIDDCD
jgi:CheY-like chemotaxis protein